MKKQNKVANIAYNVGVSSFVIMVSYAIISVLVVISMIADGDEDEALMVIPWLLGILTGGLAETGICFVIAEVVEKLDDINRCLYESLTLLRKSSNDRENAAKLYDDKLPEL